MKTILDVCCGGRMFYFDKQNELVVFDPPHLFRLGQNSWMAKKYGKLDESWRGDLAKGFDECMRVLKPGGTLIFKWNENQIKLNEVLKCFSVAPLLGQKTVAETHWLVFFKGVKQ